MHCLLVPHGFICAQMVATDRMRRLLLGRKMTGIIFLICVLIFSVNIAQDNAALDPAIFVPVDSPSVYWGQ
jgi:hypothetical protein